MSYKIRDPNRSSPTGPPELLSRTERMWLFAEQHRSAVLIGVLLVCLAAVAIGIIVWLEHQHEQQALALEHQATQLYLNRSLDEPEQSKENLEKAVTLFQQIIEEFPHTSSAGLSWYFLGNARVEQEDYAGAIKAYEHYTSSFTEDPTLLGLVLQRLGSAYILEGAREKGFDAYNQILNLPGALNKDQVLFELAKLEELEDHSEKALAYYKQLQDQYPASPYVNEATMRIRVLGPPQENSENPSEEDAPTEPDETMREDEKE